MGLVRSIVAPRRYLSSSCNIKAAVMAEALREFSSCDIGDALVKLKIPFGGYLDGISMWSPTRQGVGESPPTVVGPAVTVKLVDVDDTTAPKPDVHFADANEPGKVMFIQQPPHMYSACFGGLMATRAKYIGAAGVVVDGRFRDVREIQEMKLPLFAKQTSILGSNGFSRVSEINVPLRFKDDLWINPGDLLVGDHDGVVVVAPYLVDQVIELCRARKEIDEKTMAALNAGAEMGPTLKKLRK
ncbi:ribonuclease E inhibitor RraA/Dimethylmenaquinone methyltransferase [Lineolata rhizophorae]|uniref:Ribonuclease E inhibitor RraA/Dimethylmenaquinone methyltransferase n=1 Tax=Lineolata rhizophorae TaxID=578093 RepID=A0A6A6P4X1_9PEZI|nr:ribonuclease E inhibitor RraA/Dimethylmenaquinone methyltransferase [Lineolata rhizophorae]